MRDWRTDLGDVLQTDGFTCGPTSALVAGALLDPAYAAALDTTPAGLAREQHRIHRTCNRCWPRRLGTTPWGVAAAISWHSRPLGVRYGWRRLRGRRDDLADILATVETGWPVALLVGRAVPRHWLLLVDRLEPTTMRLYDPATGDLRQLTVDQVQQRGLRPGYPRAFAVVLPRVRPLARPGEPM
jgi:hypothetical protein